MYKQSYKQGNPPFQASKWVKKLPATNSSSQEQEQSNQTFNFYQSKPSSQQFTQQKLFNPVQPPPFKPQKYQEKLIIQQDFSSSDDSQEEQYHPIIANNFNYSQVPFNFINKIKQNLYPPFLSNEITESLLHQNKLHIGIIYIEDIKKHRAIIQSRHFHSNIIVNGKSNINRVFDESTVVFQIVNFQEQSSLPYYKQKNKQQYFAKVVKVERSNIENEKINGFLDINKNKLRVPWEDVLQCKSINDLIDFYFKHFDTIFYPKNKYYPKFDICSYSQEFIIWGRKELQDVLESQNRINFFQDKLKYFCSQNFFGEYISWECKNEFPQIRLCEIVQSKWRRNERNFK